MSREGTSVLGGQTGYNKGATQSGMNIGGVRHCADIRADNMSKAGEGVLNLQMGTNKLANQSGMVMGGR